VERISTKTPWKAEAIMKCVVLLGFSTTGKSQILKQFENYSKDKLQRFDSDQEISRDHDCHIYNIYLSYSSSTDTNDATDFIAARERSFLKNIDRGLQTPLLLAAGPFLPSRSVEWKEFIHDVNPACFYLKKEPELVLYGLLERHYRHRQAPEIAEHPRFGCWDESVTTELKDGKWVLLPLEAALRNVSELIANVENDYSPYISQERTFTWRERRTPEGKARLDQAIIKQLEL
jgi:hypothetical protein